MMRTAVVVTMLALASAITRDGGEEPDKEVVQGEPSVLERFNAAGGFSQFDNDEIPMHDASSEEELHSGSLLQTGSSTYQKAMSDMIPVLKDLQGMIETDGPSAWFNGAELYAAHARQEQNGPDTPRLASSMLEMDAQAEQQAEMEKAQAEMEAQQAAMVAQMKAQSMAGLEHWIQNPAEHEAEVQRTIDEANGLADEEDNWVAQVSKDGFFKMGGQQHHVFDRGVEELKHTFQMLSSSPGFEKSEKGAKKETAMLEVAAEGTATSKTDQKKKASDMIYAAPASFRRALRSWEKLGEEALNVLLSEPQDAMDKKYDALVANLYTRSGAAQKKLKSSIKSLPNSAALLQVAQNRLTAQVAKQAASQVEAKGQVFPSLSGCVLVAKDSKTEQEAAESKCLCVTDQACLFAHDAHGKRASNLCNLLAQTGCLSFDDADSV